MFGIHAITDSQLTRASTRCFHSGRHIRLTVSADDAVTVEAPAGDDAAKAEAPVFLFTHPFRVWYRDLVRT